MATTAKCKRVVLTIQQKLDIVPNFERGSTVKQICNQYNTGDSTVRDIVKTKTNWLHSRALRILTLQWQTGKQ